MADKVKYLPFLMALGIGISVSNSIAALEGFFGKCGEFVRTPKFGVETAEDHRWKQKISHVKIKRSIVPWLEFAFGLYMVGCICMCLHFGTAPFSIPFLVLFAGGYFYVSFSSFYLQYQIEARNRQVLAEELALEPVPGLNASSKEIALLEKQLSIGQKRSNPRTIIQNIENEKGGLGNT